MGGTDIKEVNLNYHSSNQAIHLEAERGEYLTSTGNGKTKLTAVKGKDIKDASNEVKAFYNNLITVINDKNTVKINVYYNDNYIVVGEYSKSAIDISDINAFSNINNTSGVRDAVSPQGKLIHEISEQFGIQVRGLKYEDAHTNFGIPAENSVQNSIRGEDIDSTGNIEIEVRSTSYKVGNTKVEVKVLQDDTGTYVSQKK